MYTGIIIDLPELYQSTFNLLVIDQSTFPVVYACVEPSHQVKVVVGYQVWYCDPMHHVPTSICSPESVIHFSLYKNIEGSESLLGFPAPKIPRTEMEV